MDHRLSNRLAACAWALALSAGPALAERPSPGCDGATAASGTYQMADGALMRTYRMHVPAGLDAARPAPLALIFHGWGGDENEFLSDPIVTAEADRLGFVLVAARGMGSEAPDNSYNSWTFDGSATGIGNDGQPICSGAETNYAYPSCGPVGEGVAQNGCSWTQCQSDDVAFVSALIDQIAATACIDLDRVFATGGSNGGMFTWGLGQTGRTAMALRAIAPIIGLPHQGDLDPPARPDGLPVLLITGTQDPTVPPGGWEDPAMSTTADTDLYHYTGATGITQAWAEAQGCDTGVAAAPVDFGPDGMDCRSYCGADSSGLPPVLDCRAEMGHDYDFATTWPMVLDFFHRQPLR
jgi:polyhydroxybutyrate depolymerase